MNLKTDSHSIIFSGILSCIIILITSVFFFRSFFGIPNILMPFLDRANESITQILTTSFTRSDHANSHIVVVAIDDATLSSSGGVGRWSDWTREPYARVIDTLFMKGALAVGVDVLFSESAESSSDEDLARVLQNHLTHVVLGGVSGDFPIFPLPLFSSGSRLGMIDSPGESRTFSHMTPQVSLSGGVYESFSVAVLRSFLDARGGLSTHPGRMEASGWYTFHRAPYDRIPYSDIQHREILIHFLQDYRAFQTVSFRDVLSGSVGSEAFSGKLVLIGATASALGDLRMTPAGWMPGVYFHANAINTLLNRTFTIFLDRSVEYVFGVILILFLVFLSSLMERGMQIVFFVCITIIGIILQIFLFRFGGIAFSFPVQYLLILFVTIIATTLSKYMTEYTGKRVLSDTLSQYLAPELVDRFLQMDTPTRLGGERKRVTALFSDIAGFTTLSEQLSPEILIQILTEYISRMSSRILEQGGFINKYEGDAIMALWGAVIDQENQVDLACHSALLQQATLEQWNRENLGVTPYPLRVRMGIATGEAIVGNIGVLGKKLEFTAIGDTINTASRLEGINKLYHTKILISSETKSSLSNGIFSTRLLDRIRLKGKEHVVEIYELLGYQDEIQEECSACLSGHEKALQAYWGRDWGQARAIWDENNQKGDTLASVFLDRLDRLGSPPHDWDGVWRADEK